MNALLGSRIKALRTAKNYTQEQVADHLGISRQKYARVENGTNSITLDILAKIAEMLDVTVGDITRVLDEEPAVAYRAGTDGASSEKIFDMLDLFYANKHMYSRLQHRNRAYGGNSMLGSRKREIRIQADSFREKCKISRYGIIDLFKECDRIGYKLLRYPLGENADLGFAMKKDDDIIIFINTSIRLSREIFTLAHEIGHALLHLNGEQPFIDNNATIGGGNGDEKEQEANYFAACLLMPSDEVDRFIDLELPDFEMSVLSGMDIARIMSEFNVSYDVALNRLESLGKIDGKQKTQLETERTEKRVGNLLKSIGGNSRLNMASNEIVIPYEYIDFVIYNYNHNAIPRETLEKVLECYQLTIEDISDSLVEFPEEDDDLDDLIGGLED